MIGAGRALVTGATGLVGSHVVERLRADGWTVRGMVRAPSSAGELRSAGVEVATGDVLDADAFAAAAAGCDVIFHTAAVITQRGGWERYRTVNVEGTRAAIAAAERSGARLVQLSSVAVYGAARYSGDGRKTDEEAARSALPVTANYARSKRESEDLVMEANASGRIWATALRPSVIYGIRDRQFVPRVARLLRFGVAPVIGSGRATLAIVHATAVADGVVRAATTERARGNAFNLANDFEVTVNDFFRLAAKGLGIRVRPIHLPLGAARGGLAMLRAVDRAILGRKLAVATTASLDFLTRDDPFDSTRARVELGWTPTVRPEVGIPEAFRWAASHR